MHFEPQNVGKERKTNRVTKIKQRKKKKRGRKRKKVERNSALSFYYFALPPTFCALFYLSDVQNS